MDETKQSHVSKRSETLDESISRESNQNTPSIVLTTAETVSPQFDSVIQTNQPSRN